MEALILGAGYATRLYPLTLDRPKPLLSVGRSSILERICDQLAATSAFERIHLVTNHRFAGHYDRWLEEYRERRRLPLDLKVHDDRTTTPENRLGAIGDIQFVIEEASIHDDLVVIAGDNLIEGDLNPFLAHGRRNGTSVGLKDLKLRTLVSLYGVVELDSQGRIVGFEEKPAVPRSTLVAVGLYYLPKPTLPCVKRYLEQGNGKDAPGYYVQWLHSQLPVYGYLLEGDWFDIGDLESYRQADELMKRKEAS